MAFQQKRAKPADLTASSSQIPSRSLSSSSASASAAPNIPLPSAPVPSLAPNLAPPLDSAPSLHSHPHLLHLYLNKPLPSLPLPPLDDLYSRRDELLSSDPPFRRSVSVTEFSANTQPSNDVNDNLSRASSTASQRSHYRSALLSANPSIVNNQAPLPSGSASASPSPASSSSHSPGVQKKPSLSQRRGLRLNMHNITQDSADDQDPDSASATTSASASTLCSASKHHGSTSSNPAANQPPLVLRQSSKRHNFRLNLDTSSSAPNASAPASVSDTQLDSAQLLLLLPQSASTALATPQPGLVPLNGPKAPQKLQGLFANYSKYVDIKSGLLNFAGKASLHSKGVDFSSGLLFRISLDELEFIEELGHGNYGSVLKVVHKPTGVLMAMKEVRLELDEQKFTQILMELEILHNCDSPYIVDFYGAFFVEGAVYMCMEYMDAGSLDNIYGNGHGIHDEPSLAFVAECIIRGLKELKDTHNIIHRDIKPTNILVNTLGKVKLCDFGVLGNLVASLAKTNIGCQSYMAPERIRGINPDDATYLVQLDVWSLGLTLLEVAAGQYPYPGDTYGNIFSQLSAIVDGEPPRLDPQFYSKDAQAFVRSCLAKNPKLRPSYAALLASPWLEAYRGTDPRLAELVLKRVHDIQQSKPLSRHNSNNNNKGGISHADQTAHAMPPSATAAPTSVTSAAEKPAGRTPEKVHQLLRNKAQPPALHRGGLALRGRGLAPGRSP